MENEMQPEPEEGSTLVQAGMGNLRDRLQPLIDTLNATNKNDTLAVIACVAYKESKVDFHLIADRETDVNRLLLLNAMEMIKMVLENKASTSLEDLLLAMLAQKEAASTPVEENT
jgi:hypothetical protein